MDESQRDKEMRDTINTFFFERMNKNVINDHGYSTAIDSHDTAFEALKQMLKGDEIGMQHCLKLMHSNETLVGLSSFHYFKAGFLDGIRFRGLMEGDDLVKSIKGK